MEIKREVLAVEYELTDNERALATWLVNANQNSDLDEQFLVFWVDGGALIYGYGGDEPQPEFTTINLDALVDEGLLRCKASYNKGKETGRECVITRRAYTAVADDFVKPKPESQQPSVINQTNNFYAEVNQSAIGPHSHVELTQNLDLGATRRQIDEEGGEYASDLHRLLDLVESSSRDGKTLEPGSLSEFNEAMQNRSWIVSPVVSLILGALTQIPM